MIKSKSIIIFGASGGIGSVIARKAVAEGHNVTLCGRTEETLFNLAASLGSPHQTCIAQCDATNTKDVENAWNEAVSRFSRVDAVVISVGGWDRLSLDGEMGEALTLAEKHFRAHFLPSFVVGFVAQKLFRKQGEGLIINLSSHAAYRWSLKGNLTYGPMKAASRQFMLALRHELEGSGVRVCDISPAIVNTEDNARLLDTEEKRAKAVQPEDIADWILANLDNQKIPPERHFDSQIEV